MTDRVLRALECPWVDVLAAAWSSRPMHTR